MKRSLIWAFMLAFVISVQSPCQHSFPASDTTNSWTGPNTFTNIFTLPSLADGCLHTSTGIVLSTGSPCSTLTSIITSGSSGLTGGGSSGALSLSLLTSCSVNQLLQWNGSAWICATISAGSGTVTGTGTGQTYALWNSASNLTNAHLNETIIGSQPQFNFNGPRLSIATADGSGQAYITCPNCSGFLEIIAPSGDGLAGGSIFLGSGSNNSCVSLNPGNGNPFQVCRGTTNSNVWQIAAGDSFANLPTGIVDGSYAWCSDCHENSDPCTGSGGTGDFAFRINGRWKCY